MPVELLRDEDRPHVADLELSVGEYDLLGPAPLAALREIAEGLPDAVAVLSVGAGGAPPRGDDWRGLSAGLELAWAIDRGPAARRAALDALYEAVQAVRDVDAVTVAACGEFALGLPEIDVGLPTVVQGGLLVPHVGLGRAKELVYRGIVLSGSDARTDGLVTEAPPAERYPTAVGSLVDELAGKAPSVLQRQTRIFRSWRSRGLEAGLRESVALGGRSFGTEAAREGMAAFLAGREPDFSAR